ncbi:MAG: thioredoxin family protein [Hyphomicrobiales bacterium]
MFTRRHALALISGGAMSVATRPLMAANPTVELGEDGLYHQDWFLESFLELADDLNMASENGKRFAVIWELKGCPYCKETHFVNFAREDISKFVKSNFDILQLNIIGSRTVTDFDGEELSEKALAKKYGVRFTPTIQFFPEAMDGLAKAKPKTREVARAQGYLKPDHFLKMFQFVEGKSYKTMKFRQFLKTGS